MLSAGLTNHSLPTSESYSACLSSQSSPHWKQSSRKQTLILVQCQSVDSPGKSRMRLTWVMRLLSLQCDEDRAGSLVSSFFFFFLQSEPQIFYPFDRTRRSSALNDPTSTTIHRPVQMEPLFVWKTPQVVAATLWRRWWMYCKRSFRLPRLFDHVPTEWCPLMRTVLTGESIKQGSQTCSIQTLANTNRC